AITMGAELSALGFDSVSLTQFSNELNRAHGLDLMPTVFFEYPTLSGLAEHLVQEHRTKFAEKLTGLTQTEHQLQAMPLLDEATVLSGQAQPKSWGHRRFAQAAAIR